MGIGNFLWGTAVGACSWPLTFIKVSRLGRSGAIPLLPVYALVACTRGNLPFHIPCKHAAKMIFRSGVWTRVNVREVCIILYYIILYYIILYYIILYYIISHHITSIIYYIILYQSYIILYYIILYYIIIYYIILYRVRQKNLTVFKMK